MLLGFFINKCSYFQDGLIEIKEEMHEQQQNTDEISFMASSAPGGEGSNNVQANQASAAHQLVNMSQVTPAALLVRLVNLLAPYC